MKKERRKNFFTLHENNDDKLHDKSINRSQVKNEATPRTNYLFVYAFRNSKLTNVKGAEGCTTCTFCTF